MAKFYSIDPETCSIEELEQAIKAVGDKVAYYNDNQLATKTFINSVYGVFGTQFFNLCNTDIAESITLQGQHLIKYSVEKINEYFRNMWCGDTEAHDRIVSYMKNIYPDFNGDEFKRLAASNPLMFETLQIYGDTDSAYITFQPIIDACMIPVEQQTDFDIAVYESVLEGYMDVKFDEYAESFHCEENLEKFELEKISRSVIMLAKKNYMCDVAWIDTPRFCEPLSHITYTGFDVVKGVTTDYCRTEMMDFTNFVMSYLNRGDVPAVSELVTKLRDMKTRFTMQSPNDISKTVSISDYEQYILNDKDPNGVVYHMDQKKNQPKTPPIHVRAAAVYNNMLLTKNKKYLSKYSLIKTGDKVRFYYKKVDFWDPDNNVFGFVPDAFPMEFAPPMDIDTQFEKSLLSPLNRIVSALGYAEIPSTLTYVVRLFG